MVEWCLVVESKFAGTRGALSSMEQWVLQANLPSQKTKQICQHTAIQAAK